MSWHPLYSPLRFILLQLRGSMALVRLTIPVTVVQPGFVNGEQSEGASGGGCGSPPPKFEYENEISCTLNAIIIGVG